MLITKTHYDVPTKLDANGRPIRIFVISPVVANYPHAKFPGKLHRFPLIADELIYGLFLQALYALGMSFTDLISHLHFLIELSVRSTK